MNNQSSYNFTVCTPTLNRANLLGRVYDSLKRQDYKDFEWLIVDDGSTDNTGVLAESWIKEAILPIRYIKQENKGKHAALNVGLDNARGRLFLVIDSDDYFVDNALSIFWKYWQSLADQASFSGVLANCMDPAHNIIGSEFPEDVYDSDFIEVFYRRKVRGDKCGFFVTDILRAYKFPVFPGENFLSEALVWNRLALKYKTRFINDRLLVADYQPGGLSDRSVVLRMKNPLGAIVYYQEFLDLPLAISWKLRNLVNYIRFSLHGRINIWKQARALKPAYLKFFFPFFLPLGLFFFYSDRRK
ncbi:MAG: glycosyltransferase family A protein [Patescibacteria group bacterium]|jgi:glycosyltransferase involved in cell wall biosynthesis